MPESTERQIAKIEEGLSVWELLKLLETANHWSRKVDKLRYPIECEEAKATPDQIRYAPLLKKYFNDRWGIAQQVLQLEMNEELKPLSQNARKEELRTWIAEPLGSLLRRKAEVYIRSQTSEQCTNCIKESRADIAQNVLEIRKGLQAFHLDGRFLLWPILTTDGDETSAEVASSGDELGSEPSEVATSGAAGGEGTGSDGAANARPSKKKSELPPYQGLIDAHITLARTKGLKGTWEEVAKQIKVGDGANDDTFLLPPAFVNRITETHFGGSLFEFIQLEDKKRTELIRKGTDPKKLIDFKERFSRTFSAVKVAREKRENAAAQSKK